MEEKEIQQKAKDLLEQLKGLSFANIRKIAYQLIDEAEESAIVN